MLGFGQSQDGKISHAVHVRLMQTVSLNELTIRAVTWEEVLLTGGGDYDIQKKRLEKSIDNFIADYLAANETRATE